jgi:hypothetical protein
MILRRFLIVLFMMLFAVSAFAASLTFQWDAMPGGQNWTKVRLYEKNGSTYTMLSEVASTVTQTTVTVTPGAHNFVVRAYDGVWESVDSNVVVTGPVPTAPSNFKIFTIVLAGIGGIAVLLGFLFKKRS